MTELHGEELGVGLFGGVETEQLFPVEQSDVVLRREQGLDGGPAVLFETVLPEVEGERVQVGVQLGLDAVEVPMLGSLGHPQPILVLSVFLALLLQVQAVRLAHLETEAMRVSTLVVHQSQLPQPFTIAPFQSSLSCVLQTVQILSHCESTFFPSSDCLRFYRLSLPTHLPYYSIHSSS